ncbi:galactose-1-phosphate uridylyltransferase [gut metagenome]|uniref:Galactose-1-phosphate uridylyltransferase n=1 Tax=gut metagenome TaxID=749906 RepID=J9GBI6_9ZZZZ
MLRNNLTTEEYPLGVFHPHQELHHIKKENIGLIEVMGLAVLPARLKNELEAVAAHLADGSDLASDPLSASHAAWAEKIKTSHPEMNADNVTAIVQEEVGKVFATVLEHAGVYKRDAEGQAALDRFIKTLG